MLVPALDLIRLAQAGLFWGDLGLIIAAPSFKGRAEASPVLRPKKLGLSFSGYLGLRHGAIAAQTPVEGEKERLEALFGSRVRVFHLETRK